MPDRSSRNEQWPGEWPGVWRTRMPPATGTSSPSVSVPSTSQEGNLFPRKLRTLASGRLVSSGGRFPSRRNTASCSPMCTGAPVCWRILAAPPTWSLWAWVSRIRETSAGRFPMRDSAAKRRFGAPFRPASISARVPSSSSTAKELIALDPTVGIRQTPVASWTGGLGMAAACHAPHPPARVAGVVEFAPDRRIGPRAAVLGSPSDREVGPVRPVRTGGAVAERERSHTRPLGGRFVAHSQVLTAADVQRALTRMAHEVAERNGGLEDVVIIGLQTGGVDLANRMAKVLQRTEGDDVKVG